MASWSFKSSRSYRANVISQIVEMAHCQLFQKMSVCTKAFAFHKCKLRYLGQSSEWTVFASSELRPWLKQAFPMTIPNTLKYLITNPAKACTTAIQTNHHWTLHGRLWPTQWFKGYTQIMILLFSFLFAFFFLLQGFGFNLQIVINGIFNFLVCEAGWTGQRA